MASKSEIMNTTMVKKEKKKKGAILAGFKDIKDTLKEGVGFVRHEAKEQKNKLVDNVANAVGVDAGL